MIHAVRRLAARSWVRLLAVWAALAVTAGICCVFAWMAPSLVAARTSGLSQLPQNERLEQRASAAGDPTCSDVYDYIYIIGPGGATAHPLTVVNGRLPQLLGLAGTAEEGAVVTDALVATEGGLESGDEVSIVFPDRTIRGSARVHAAPARIDEGSTGSMWINLGRADIALAVAEYGPPDRSLCIGPDSGQTVASLLAAAREASTREGLASSGDVFASLVQVGWVAATLLTLAVTLHRRRALMILARGLGASRSEAVTLGYADALAVTGFAALSGAIFALWLRSDILRLWTDTSAAAPTIVIFLLAIALSAVLAAVATWRLLP
jgi:hypothetical protein